MNASSTPSSAATRLVLASDLTIYNAAEHKEALLQALKVLVPRHQPIVASPHAAEITRLASMPASDWRDPAMAIAAREHARRSREQIARLERGGVVVLDEPEDKLDRAVLDAYLKLRRRRRV